MAATPRPAEGSTTLWDLLKKKLLEETKKTPPDQKSMEILLWMVEEEMK